jgi:hypothetical protein
MKFPVQNKPKGKISGTQMANKTKKTGKKVNRVSTKIVTRQIRHSTSDVVKKRTAKPLASASKRTAKPLTMTSKKTDQPITNTSKKIAKPSIKTLSKSIQNFNQSIKTKIRTTHPVRVQRDISAASAAHRQAVRLARAPQFTYMNAPGLEDVFDVGNTVEVFCDHEQASERVRGWIKGTVVQVDNKLVAVQFRSNVFLTDGWMVPDRILWYSLTSDQIRSATVGKKGSKKVIPDY